MRMSGARSWRGQRADQNDGGEINPATAAANRVCFASIESFAPTSAEASDALRSSVPANLTTAQAEALRVLIGKHLRFLNRLIDRMTRVGIAPTDELFISALRARDALQHLHVACHYASCRGGVGK